MLSMLEYRPSFCKGIPVLFPIITQLGFDPIWFGVFCVMSAELALITPPVGMNVFVINAVVPDVPLNTIYRGTIPYVITVCVSVVIVVYFPQIATFLPKLMMG